MSSFMDGDLIIIINLGSRAFTSQTDSQARAEQMGIAAGAQRERTWFCSSWIRIQTSARCVARYIDLTSSLVLARSFDAYTDVLPEKSCIASPHLALRKAHAVKVADLHKFQH